MFSFTIVYLLRQLGFKTIGEMTPYVVNHLVLISALSLYSKGTTANFCKKLSDMFLLTTGIAAILVE